MEIVHSSLDSCGHLQDPLEYIYNQSFALYVLSKCDYYLIDCALYVKALVIKLNYSVFERIDFEQLPVNEFNLKNIATVLANHNKELVFKINTTAGK